VETASNLKASVPAFHAEDLDQVANYRSMSGLAIVSLLFGLASPVCFAALVFLPIPLFGAALSVIALRRIADSDGALAGKWAAATGLALCVASAAASLSYAQVTRFMHARQARQVGQEWIELILSGKTQEAFDLTVQSTRSEPPEPPANLPGAGPPMPPYEQFVTHPTVQALKSAGAGAEVRFAETLSYQPQPQRQCFVDQQFLVSPGPSSAAASQNAERPIDVRLTLQFSRFPGQANLHWRVLGYSRQEQTTDVSPK
jgi:hypothetical protein